MSRFPVDIYTEPSDVDTHTLRNLGPLAHMAGIWEGERGVDIHPKPEGPTRAKFIERMELQPLDPQTNGPQLFYGLRYHTRVVQPGEIATFHDQVGYWLWEPATGTVIHSLAIPRAQVALASGRASARSRTFELEARRGRLTYGICSTPFLEYAFRTVGFRIRVRIHSETSWSYDEITLLKVRGRKALFEHRDRNRLQRIAAPSPNPLARAPAA